MEIITLKWKLQKDYGHWYISLLENLNRRNRMSCMNGVIYYSHSYRPEDGKIVDYFGELINKQNLILSLDPPSKSFSRAKLTRHLNNCDGMIAILNTRVNGVSPYILFEVQTCIKAKKPLLVFIEDSLDDTIIPVRILQKRFSRNSFFHQIREHQHIIRHFCDYLGNECPPRYQAYSRKKTCICIGLASLEHEHQTHIVDLIENRGYNINQIFNAGVFSDLSRLDSIDLLSSSDIALVIIDESEPITYYLLGLLEGLSIPSIFVTISELSKYSGSVPDDFKFHQLLKESFNNTLNYIDEQFSIFEQDFLELDENIEIKEYVSKLISNPIRCEASSPMINIGSYINSAGSIIEKQQNVSADTIQTFRAQTQKVTIAEQINYNQMWEKSQSENNLDFSEIIKEFTIIKGMCSKDPKITEKIDQAIEAAKNNDGPTVLKTLHEMMKEPNFKDKIHCCLKSVKNEALGNIGITLASGAVAVLVKLLVPF